MIQLVTAVEAIAPIEVISTTADAVPAPVAASRPHVASCGGLLYSVPLAESPVHRSFGALEVHLGATRIPWTSETVRDGSSNPFPCSEDHLPYRCLRAWDISSVETIDNSSIILIAAGTVYSTDIFLVQEVFKPLDGRHSLECLAKISLHDTRDRLLASTIVATEEQACRPKLYLAYAQGWIRVIPLDHICHVYRQSIVHREPCNSTSWSVTVAGVRSGSPVSDDIIIRLPTTITYTSAEFIENRSSASIDYSVSSLWLALGSPFQRTEIFPTSLSSSEDGPPKPLCAPLSSHGGIIFAICSNSKWLVTASDDREIHVWQRQSSENLKAPDTAVSLPSELRGANNDISIDPRQFADPFELMHRIRGVHQGRIWQLQFCDENTVLSAGEDGNLARIDCYSGSARIIHIHWSIQCVASTGAFGTLGGRAGRLALRDMANGTDVGTVTPGDNMQPAISLEEDVVFDSTSSGKSDWVRAFVPIRPLGSVKSSSARGTDYQQEHQFLAVTNFGAVYQVSFDICQRGKLLELSTAAKNEARWLNGQPAAKKFRLGNTFAVETIDPVLSGITPRWAPHSTHSPAVITCAASPFNSLPEGSSLSHSLIAGTAHGTVRAYDLGATTVFTSLEAADTAHCLPLLWEHDLDWGGIRVDDIFLSPVLTFPTFGAELSPSEISSFLIAAVRHDGTVAVLKVTGPSTRKTARLPLGSLTIQVPPKTRGLTSWRTRGDSGIAPQQAQSHFEDSLKGKHASSTTSLFMSSDDTNNQSRKPRGRKRGTALADHACSPLIKAAAKIRSSGVEANIQARQEFEGQSLSLEHNTTEVASSRWRHTASFTTGLFVTVPQSAACRGSPLILLVLGNELGDVSLVEILAHPPALKGNFIDYTQRSKFLHLHHTAFRAHNGKQVSRLILSPAPSCSFVSIGADGLIIDWHIAPTAVDMAASSTRDHLATTSFSFLRLIPRHYIKFAQFDFLHSLDLASGLLLAFRGTEFIVWDMHRDGELAREVCGGPRRCAALRAIPAEYHSLIAAEIVIQTPLGCRIYRIPRWAQQQGVSGLTRSFNAGFYSAGDLSVGVCFDCASLLVGGEDGCLRLIEAAEANRGLMSGHVSSRRIGQLGSAIKSIAVAPCVNAGTAQPDAKWVLMAGGLFRLQLLRVTRRLDASPSIAGDVDVEYILPYGEMNKNSLIAILRQTMSRELPGPSGDSSSPVCLAAASEIDWDAWIDVKISNLVPICVSDEFVEVVGSVSNGGLLWARIDVQRRSFCAATVIPVEADLYTWLGHPLTRGDSTTGTLDGHLLAGTSAGELRFLSLTRPSGGLEVRSIKVVSSLRVHQRALVHAVVMPCYNGTASDADTSSQRLVTVGDDGNTCEVEATWQEGGGLVGLRLVTRATHHMSGVRNVASVSHNTVATVGYDDKACLVSVSGLRLLDQHPLRVVEPTSVTFLPAGHQMAPMLAITASNGGVTLLEIKQQKSPICHLVEE